MPGVRGKLSTRPELKWVDYWSGLQTADPTITRYFLINQYPLASQQVPRLIWSTDSNQGDSNGVPFNPNPPYVTNTIEQTGNNGRDGTQWQYKWIDLRFTIHAVTATSYNNNLFRMMVVKNKIAGQVPIAGNVPQSFNEPIDTKVWNIIMDKTFTHNNGYTAGTQVASVTPGAGIVTQETSNIQSAPKNFRMKIPFRMLAETSRSVAFVGTPPITPVYTTTQFRSNYNIYVLLFEWLPCNDFAYTDVRARIYFMDP